MAYHAIKAKHTIGIRKAIDIPKRPPIRPISGGQNAPPATAITRNEAPFLVSGPKSLIPKAKIVGNMIDIKK